MTKIIVRAMIIKGHADVRSLNRNTIDARKKNEKLLFSILKKNRSTEYGKKHNFAGVKTVEDYRRTVPLTTYHDYEEYLSRMIENNETGLLTALPLAGYAQSSGSSGKRKFIPLTGPQIRIYTKYTVTRMLAITDSYYRKVLHKKIKPGRGLFPFPGFSEYLDNGLPCSNVVDAAAVKLGFVYPYILNIPFKKMFTAREADWRYVVTRFALIDRDTMYSFSVFLKAFADVLDYLRQNWEALVRDIETGEVGELAQATPETIAKIKAASPADPKRAAELRREFEKGFDETLVQRIWPNMSVICGIGTASFAPFLHRIEKLTGGKIPTDSSIYGCSEGLIAAVNELNSTNYILLIDSCYYEFIPVDEPGRILSLDELEVGKEYEIVITNQAGLYRYSNDDVIKVVGYMNDCPLIQFAYRKGQLLNFCGEKTSEEHISDLVKALEKASGTELSNWAVYNDLDDFPYHYVLLLENSEGKDMSEYDDFADAELDRINVRYKLYKTFREIGRIRIRNQVPGTHAAWVEKQVAKGTPASTVKPVRILDTAEKEEFFLSRIQKNES